MDKIGANDPCPCGSGNKYKRCCRDAAVAPSYGPEDRGTAFAKLDAYIDKHLDEENEAAFDEFWSSVGGDDDELPRDFLPASNDAFDMWFVFDRQLADGRVPVEAFLGASRDLTPRERLFLQSLRHSTLRLYEIVDVVPGISLTLRDVLEGDRVTVSERRGSRTMTRHQRFAARVVSRGASGSPEIEAGLLHIPDLIAAAVETQLEAHRANFRREHPGAPAADFYRQMPPFFHAAWAGSILDPPVPVLRNKDGDLVTVTRVSFDILDVAALAQTLAATPGLAADGERRWTWRNTGADGAVTATLGFFELRGTTLMLETNSVARGERGRALVESVAGSAVRHRVTTHEDLTARVRQSLKERAGSEDEAHARDPTGAAAVGIPREVGDAVILEHLARHYRSWIDEPVPALDDRTPRAASQDAALRPRLVGLLEGLQGMYEQALKDGAPGHDPSWMWGELGLDDDAAASGPPPLAHERLAQLVPGSAEVARAAAERLRRHPSFSDKETTLADEAFDTDLEVQRFIRDHDAAAGPDRAWSLAPYLRLMVSFDLHRRKAFWVDPALAYMLAHTEPDVPGHELRAPFPSFALVFSDRVMLSAGERLLAGAGRPLSGQILRVITVYGAEERHGAARTLRLSWAFDALGADPPELVSHSLALADDEAVVKRIDELAPPLGLEAVGAGAAQSPLRSLLVTAVNAILYATSAGVEPELRRAPVQKARAKHGSSVAPRSSEEVYFLPGAIDITHVRRLQELERVSEGRQALHRFMVRGHWRRAAPRWEDQRVRWIQPYWKGPSMAAVIERTYRLRP